MQFIRNNKPLVGIGALIGLAIVGWLAFGFFGVQALFIDDEVDQANPFAVEATAADDEAMEEEDAPAETAEDSTSDDTAAEDAAMEEDETRADPSAGPIVESSGDFIGLEHAAIGQASILSDGAQRFLRFEDFETDNGPDLFVYLVADASAEGDRSAFDQEFVNLGRLQGNIGNQNYEVDLDLDLDRYNTVVIWCDRFNAAFAAADLA